MLAFVTCGCKYVAMPESAIDQSQIVYDTERAESFYKLIVRKGNLPTSLIPSSDVGAAPVIDAIIGAYIESSDYQINAAAGSNRVEAAISYLIGVTEEELAPQIVGFKGSAKPFEYARTLARLGARTFKEPNTNKVGHSQRPMPTDQLKLFRKVAKEYTPLSVAGYVDLDDTIKRLYHERTITSGPYAQALLLLFEQQKSNFPLEVQRDAIIGAANSLRGRIYSHPGLQSGNAEDSVFVHGASLILGRIGDARLAEEPTRMASLVTRQSMALPKLQPSEVEAIVTSHIAYALEQLHK